MKMRMMMMMKMKMIRCRKNKQAPPEIPGPPDVMPITCSIAMTVSGNEKKKQQWQRLISVIRIVHHH